MKITKGLLNFSVPAEEVRLILIRNTRDRYLPFVFNTRVVTSESNCTVARSIVMPAIS